MSAERPVDILMRTVVATGLCTRCGTCVGACPDGTLSIRDPIGGCLPEAGGECSACGLCLASCPGDRVSFETLERELFGDASSHELLGAVRHVHLAHAADPELRARGSSGAVVTALLLDLLRRREIGAALLFAPHETEPWRGWGRLVSDAGQIVAASQSRYHLSPLNAALPSIEGFPEPVAYVGLPCHVHGLRKLSRAGWRPAAPLDPVIGIYCGNNLHFAATRALLRKLGVGSPDEVSYLAYREGRWPGSFFVRTADGRERSVSKLHFNQAIPFYINRRCLFCVDLTNELADISVGDGWMKEAAGSDGWAVVLVRSDRGERIFRAALESGAIVAEGIAPGDAVRMHAHAFDLKKRGSFLRLGLWRRFGCAVPRYDRRPPAAGIGRRCAELFVSAQFAVASSGLGRALFAVLPFGATGRFFAWLRAVWMRSASRSPGP